MQIHSESEIETAYVMYGLGFREWEIKWEITRMMKWKLGAWRDICGLIKAVGRQ